MRLAAECSFGFSHLRLAPLSLPCSFACSFACSGRARDEGGCFTGRTVSPVVPTASCGGFGALSSVVLWVFPGKSAAIRQTRDVDLDHRLRPSCSVNLRSSAAFGFAALLSSENTMCSIDGYSTGSFAASVAITLQCIYLLSFSKADSKV